MVRATVAAVVMSLAAVSGAMAQGCPEGHWEFVAPPTQSPATFRAAGGHLWALETKASPTLWRWDASLSWQSVATFTSSASFAWGATAVGDRLLFRGAFTAVNGATAAGAAYIDLATGASTPITDTVFVSGLAGVQSDGVYIYRSGSEPLPGMTSQHAWWDGQAWRELTPPPLANSFFITMDGVYSAYSVTQPGPNPRFVHRYDRATNTWPLVGDSTYVFAAFEYQGTLVGWSNVNAGCSISSCDSTSLLRFDGNGQIDSWNFNIYPCWSENGWVSQPIRAGQFVYVSGSFYAFKSCNDFVEGGRYIFDLETRRPFVPVTWLPLSQSLGGVTVGFAWLSAHGVALWRPGCGCDATASWDVRDSASLGQRRLPTVAWGPRNQLVSFGGRRPGGVDAGDTQVWNGSTWTAVAGSGPSARADTALASGLPGYYSGEAPIVLFGGKRSNNTVIGDLWEFNGSTWSSVNAAGTRPTARGGHAMCAWGSGLLLFGGFTETGLADTVASIYSPDTDSWVVAPATQAPARFAHAMAYDVRRNVVVMFGGRDASGLLADTWEFSYYNWTRHPGPGPSARDYHSMHWDAKLGGVRLIGGRDASGPLQDQWLYTAAGWQRLEDVPGGPRWAHASAANFTGDQIIIGGIDATGMERADTMVTSFEPVIVQQPADAAASLGQSIVLAVSTSSEGPVSFQWYRDQTPLVDGGRISGATTAVLTIESAVATDAGTYSVQVSNCAAGVTSRQVMVSVATCDTIDFNRNDVYPEEQDVVDFFNVLAGGECAVCNDIDFNNNGVYPEEQDVIDFFNVLAGGSCPG